MRVTVRTPLMALSAAALLAVLPVAGHAEALDQEAVQKLIDEAVAAQQGNINHVWTMLSAALVLFMQVGFMLLEAGMVRSKNSISVAQKNLADFLVAACVFWLVGFGLMFGPSIGGFIGNGSFALGQVDDWNFTFFVFQVVFCGTAATIVSGAIAERMTFHAYLAISALVSGLIYPVFGHWAWGNLLSGDTVWLASEGFIDFAGSTVVHSMGGWVSLAALVVVGARIGRFDENGKPVPIVGHSAALSTGGCLILWVGWVGFNGGSTTTGSGTFAHIVSNTMMAGAFGGLVSMLAGRAIDGIFRPERSINGVLGGLVAITAGCDAVGTHAAILIGASGGIVVILAGWFLESVLKLDDAVGAVPVHGFCGAWGTLMVAFFAREELLVDGSRWSQFLVQAEGAFAAFAWGFGSAYVLLHAIKLVMPLRVSPEHEILGLNSAEHGTTLGTGSLQVALAQLATGTMDLTQRLDETTGDEAAEVAHVFNRLMTRLQGMVDGLAANTRRLARSAAQLDGTARELDTRSRQALDHSGAAAAASETVSATLNAMSARAAQASDAAQQASAETASVSSQVSGVVGEIERLSQAIAEIAQHVRRTEDQSRQAVARSAGASTAMSELEQATAEIETVLQAIRDIASKTHMLALNATIEAARAGEAGKGFAVVANEVRQLAGASAQAAEAASNCIAKVNGGARGAGAALAEIASTLQGIDGAVGGIKSAIEAQTSAAAAFQTALTDADRAVRAIDSRIGAMVAITGEIRESAKTATADATQVAATMTDLRGNMNTSQLSAEQVRANAAEVAATAANLDSMIGQMGTRNTAPGDTQTVSAAAKLAIAR